MRRVLDHSVSKLYSISCESLITQYPSYIPSHASPWLLSIRAAVHLMRVLDHLVSKLYSISCESLITQYSNCIPSHASPWSLSIQAVGLFHLMRFHDHSVFELHSSSWEFLITQYRSCVLAHSSLWSFDVHVAFHLYIQAAVCLMRVLAALSKRILSTIEFLITLRPSCLLPCIRSLIVIP